MVGSEAMSPKKLIAEMRARNLDELELGCRRLIELGEPMERIEVLMLYAAIMLHEQVACCERRLGLAPAVVVH